MSDVMCIHGTPLVVRPIERSDVEDLGRMFGHVSPEGIYFRFFSPLPQVPQSMLRRFAEVDHCRRDALVVLDGSEIVAMASYDELPPVARSGARDVEIAVTVEDAWQHRGVGVRLMRHLTVLARERGYDTLIAKILPTNRAALGLIRKIAPDVTVKYNGGEYEARVPLTTSIARDARDTVPGGTL